MTKYQLIESEPHTDYVLCTGSYDECVHKFVALQGVAFEQGIERGLSKYFIEEIHDEG